MQATEGALTCRRHDLARVYDHKMIDSFLRSSRSVWPEKDERLVQSFNWECRSPMERGELDGAAEKIPYVM
jgi:hypothetical protein